MSEIRVNTIVAAEGTSAPNLPYGIQVPTGMGITGAGGVNITGVVTAVNIDGTLIAGSAINSAGVSTVGILTVTKDARIGAAVTVDGAATVTGAVNIDATTDSTSVTTGALIVDGGVGIAKNVYIGAGLSVAGTLTYEDVTNVDSVGLITARSGIKVTNGDIDILADNKKLNVGAGADLQLYHNGSDSMIHNTNGNLTIRGDYIQLNNASNSEGMLTAAANGAVSIRYDNVVKLETSSSGVKVTGGYTENIVTVSGTEVDCSAGGYFTKTITGATTFTFANVPSGVAYAFTFEVTLNGSNAITWPASVKWPADTAPTITDGKTQVFVFLTDDGGTRWRGSSLVDYTN